MLIIAFLTLACGVMAFVYFLNGHSESVAAGLLVLFFIGIIINITILLPQLDKIAAEQQKRHDKWVEQCHAKGGNVLITNHGNHCVSKQFLLD